MVIKHGVSYLRPNALIRNFSSGVYNEGLYAKDEPPADSDKKYYSAYHNEHVEEVVIAGYGYKKDKGIDILLTAEWGAQWNHYSDSPLRVQGSPAVKRLGAELSMKYHFCGTEGVYHSHPVYRNFLTLGVTRFYGMAHFGNKEKAKALQAFSILPPSNLQSSAELKATTELYENAPENPYAWTPPIAKAAESSSDDEEIFPDAPAVVPPRLP